MDLASLLSSLLRHFEKCLIPLGWEEAKTDTGNTQTHTFGEGREEAVTCQCFVRLPLSQPKAETVHRHGQGLSKIGIQEEGAVGGADQAAAGAGAIALRDRAPPVEQGAPQGSFILAQAR